MKLDISDNSYINDYYFIKEIKEYKLFNNI